eukprot:175829-Pyramimonas_sp.AAC.1
MHTTAGCGWQKRHTSGARIRITRPTCVAEYQPGGGVRLLQAGPVQDRPPPGHPRLGRLHRAQAAHEPVKPHPPHAPALRRAQLLGLRRGGGGG